MLIRPATALDLEAMAGLWSSVVGDPITSDALRLWDGLALATDRRLRLVADDGGRVVGLLAMVSTIDSATCGLRLFVAARERRRGLGSRLFARARAFVAIYGGDAVATTARDASSEAFAIDRGFGVVARTIVMERSLTTDDAFDHATPKDVELRSLSELAGDADDAFYVSVRALGESLGPGLPRAHFDARVLGPRGEHRALQVLALSQGRIVGVSCVEPFPGTRVLLHTLTAVSPSHRGRGIGRALKLGAMRAAYDAGMTKLVTHVAPSNAAMLAIDGRCGFVQTGTEATLVATIAQIVAPGAG